MAVGSGRAVGAWIMLAGAVAVVLATVVAGLGADAIDAQMRALDASKDSIDGTIALLASALVLLAAGLLAFLVGALTFLVGSARARKRGAFVAEPSRAIASAASGALAIAILLALLAPHGPVQRLTAAATQSGDAVRIESHQGNLTGVAAAPNAPEDVWVYHPAKPRGAVGINFGSGGAPDGRAYALAIIEAQQADGSWKEIGRAHGGHQALQIPAQTFPADLRVRTRLDDGVIGAVQFGFAFSFAPETGPG